MIYDCSSSKRSCSGGQMYTIRSRSRRCEKGQMTSVCSFCRYCWHCCVCVCVCAGVESATVIYTDTVFITKTALQLLMKMAPWATKLIQVFSLLELLECSDACLGPRIGVTLFQFCFNWFHSCQVNHQFTIVLYCGVSVVKTLDVWLEGREFRSQHH